MGTARTGESHWALRDERFDADLALKRTLLAERHDDVLRALPGTEHAATEILDAMGAAGNRPRLRQVHPLEAAALLVQEDLCILVDGRLAAGCVCFPSHWRLADKIGLPVSDVHQRVPGYASELGAKVDAFLRRLSAGTVVERRNFTIHELPDLFAPDAPPTLGVPPPEQWLRSERQTLSRLTKSGAVLFTIRTQQVQLRDVSPDVRSKLAARLRAEPEGLIGYRGLADRVSDLVDWLAS